MTNTDVDVREPGDPKQPLTRSRRWRVTHSVAAGCVGAAAAVLVMQAVPALLDDVQYRPMWMIRDDYQRGYDVGTTVLGDRVRALVRHGQFSCRDLSVIAYQHSWSGSSQDQKAFDDGCNHAVLGEPNQRDSFGRTYRGPFG
jgi:hypothetical protein